MYKEITKISNNNNPILDTEKCEILNDVDGLYRFVSHTHKIASQGFKKESVLLTYKDMFLMLPSSTARLLKRYSNLYGKK